MVLATEEPVTSGHLDFSYTVFWGHQRSLQQLECVLASLHSFVLYERKSLEQLLGALSLKGPKTLCIIASNFQGYTPQ